MDKTQNSYNSQAINQNQIRQPLELFTFSPKLVSKQINQPTTNQNPIPMLDQYLESASSVTN